MRYHAIIGVIAAVFICATQSLGADHHVQSKGGEKVVLDGDLENEPLESVFPESVQMSPDSGPIPVIVSKTFMPPVTPNNSKTFGVIGVMVDSSGGRRNTYADVLNIADGFIPLKQPDTATAVKVFRLFEPSTAGDFPLQVEGNIVGGNGGTSQSSDSEYWCVKVPKAGNRIVIADVSTLVILGNTNIDGKICARAYPMNELTPQSGVQITFTIRDDTPSVADVFYSGTTNSISLSVKILTGMASGKVPPAPNPGATKYVLTASATGYESAVVDIPIFNARWVERTDHKWEGYDPIPAAADALKRPQLVVGTGLASQASILMLSQAVENLPINSTANATITPAQTSDINTSTDITGVAAGSADVMARKGDTTYTEMNVSVMTKQTGPKIKFIYVKDSQHSGELTSTQTKAVFDAAYDVWFYQALYEIKQADPEFDSITVPDIAGDSVTYSDAKAIVEAQAEPPAGQINVYVFWGLSNNVTGFAIGQKVGIGKQNFMNLESVLKKILGHELGHTVYFGMVPSDYPAIGDYCDDLMAHACYGRRVHKYQADVARSKAPK